MGFQEAAITFTKAVHYFLNWLIFELSKGGILKRHSSDFYGAKTAELLKGIDKDCAEVLKSSFKEFTK